MEFEEFGDELLDRLCEMEHTVYREVLETRPLPCGEEEFKEMAGLLYWHAVEQWPGITPVQVARAATTLALRHLGRAATPETPA